MFVHLVEFFTEQSYDLYLNKPRYKISDQKWFTVACITLFHDAYVARDEFWTGWKFVRLGVPFIRNHLILMESRDFTKI